MAAPSDERWRLLRLAVPLPLVEEYAGRRTLHEIEIGVVIGRVVTLYLALAPLGLILPVPTQVQLMPSNTGTDPRVGGI